MDVFQQGNILFQSSQLTLMVEMVLLPKETLLKMDQKSKMLSESK